MGALLLMVPLAITSTNGMIKRLGAGAGNDFTNLSTSPAACGVLHYYMLVKRDIRLPLAFVGALAILLAYRIAAKQFPMLRYQRKPAPQPAIAIADGRLIPPPSPAQMRSRAAPAPPS